MLRDADGHLPRRLVQAMSRFHAGVLRATGGRIGRRLAHNDMLLLTTTGRRSGRHRTVPLLYLSDGGSLVIVASYGGHDHHPDWYHNLLADPEVVAIVDGQSLPMRARTAAPPERTRLWARAVASYPGYTDYQARTEREIPVVLLDPA